MVAVQQHTKAAYEFYTWHLMLLLSPAAQTAAGWHWSCQSKDPATSSHHAAAAQLAATFLVKESGHTAAPPSRSASTVMSCTSAVVPRADSMSNAAVGASATGEVSESWTEAMTGVFAPGGRLNCKLPQDKACDCSTLHC